MQQVKASWEGHTHKSMTRQPYFSPIAVSPIRRRRCEILLYWLQSGRSGRGRQSLRKNSKAMIYPVSTRFFGHPNPNPSVVQIGFAFLPSLPA